jgi:hypothetical protein
MERKGWNERMECLLKSITPITPMLPTDMSRHLRLRDGFAKPRYSYSVTAVTLGQSKI